MSTIFFSLKNFIDRFKIPPVMRPCFALSACCLDRHPTLKINYRDRTETATLRSARAPRVAPSGQSVRAQLWRNHERTPIICSPILLPSPSSLEWAPPGRSPAQGTVGSRWPRPLLPGPQRGERGLEGYWRAFRFRSPQT